MAITANPQTGEPQEVATLLCVDDEENILSSLVRTFRPLNYRVLTATGGRRGLEILETEDIDLVISDMRMPEMNGAEFLGQVAVRWPGVIRILMTGYSDLDLTVSAINKGQIYHYLSKPWGVNDIRSCIQRALEHKRLEHERLELLETVRRQHAEVMDLNANLERKVEERVAEIEQMKTLLEKANQDLKKHIVDSISIFSSIIETREGTVAGHTRRVADLARRLAIEMGLGEDDCQTVLFAALLHDIGKVSLPDALIRRPFEALTYEERSEVVKHPVIGEAMLMSLDAMKEVARVIRAHHELYDGSGYPDGLKGDDIPVAARILAVANEYDMLKAGRLQLDSLDERSTREFLIGHRGTRYDPAIVDCLVAMLSAQGPGPTDETVITPDQLRSGMRLARDLLTRSGTVILPQGHVLDQPLIMKIRALAHSTGTQIRISVMLS